MRFLTIVAAVVLVSVLLPAAAVQNQGFLGRWNLTGTGEDTNRVYWLEVSEEGGQLSGMFLNRSGSPIKLASVAVQGKELVFQLPVGNNKQPGAEFRADPRRRQARRDDQGRRSHDQFRRRPAAEVAAEQRQREARLRHAGRSLRRQVLGGVRHSAEHLPHHLDGRGRRPDQRAADAQSRLEAEVQQLPAAGRVQARRPRATAASTCAAGTRCRCSTTTATRRTSTATCRSTGGRRRSSTPASPSASGRPSTS